MSEFFLDVYTFAASQVGVLAMGVLVGVWWGRNIERRGERLIDQSKQ